MKPACLMLARITRKNSWIAPTLAVLLALIPSSLVFADNSTPLASAPWQVFINDLELDKREYKQGEKVSGSFVLGNSAPNSVPDVYYEIILAANYDKNRFPSEFWGGKIEGPIYVENGKSIVRKFDYKLPSNIAGRNLGIRVRAIHKSGLRMGWKDAGIIVDGEPRSGKIGWSELVVNGKTYKPEEGPTVKRGDDVRFRAILSNPNNEKLTIQPLISMYNRTQTGKPLAVFRGENITLDEIGTTIYEFDVPVASSTPPLVYAGLVEFRDKRGEELFPPATFRYVVEGSIGNVNMVIVGNKTIESGESVPVSVYYTGTPADVNGIGMAQSKNATLEISLLDAKDREIGVGEIPIELNHEVQRATLDIVSARTVDSYSVRVKIKDNNDRELAEYDTMRLGEKQDDLKVIILVLAVFATLVAVLAAAKNRKKEKKREGQPLTDGGDVSKKLLLLIFLSAAFLSPPMAFAYVPYTPTSESGALSISISEPSAATVIFTGDAITIRGSFTLGSCLNGGPFSSSASAKFEDGDRLFQGFVSAEPTSTNGTGIFLVSLPARSSPQNNVPILIKVETWDREVGRFTQSGTLKIDVREVPKPNPPVIEGPNTGIIGQKVKFKITNVSQSYNISHDSAVLEFRNGEEEYDWSSANLSPVFETLLSINFSWNFDFTPAKYTNRGVSARTCARTINYGRRCSDWTFKAFSVPLPVPPAAPILGVPVMNGQNIFLTWSKPSGEINGYRLYRSTSAITDSVVLSSAQSCFAEENNLCLAQESINSYDTQTYNQGVPGIYGRRYYFRVLAYNDGGNSPLSNEASIILPFGEDPSYGLDIGLRVFDGQNVVKLAAEPGAGATSPFRISKNGKIYGIVLVPPTSSQASRVRVQTKNGIMAAKKMQ